MPLLEFMVLRLPVWAHLPRAWAMKIAVPRRTGMRFGGRIMVANGFCGAATRRENTVFADDLNWGPTIAAVL